MGAEHQSQDSNVVVLRSVSNSQEVVNTLKALLARAEGGYLTGFAYITLEPYGRYSGDVLGAARRLPILALGVIKALESEVADLIR